MGLASFLSRRCGIWNSILGFEWFCVICIDMEIVFLSCIFFFLMLIYYLVMVLEIFMFFCCCCCAFVFSYYGKKWFDLIMLIINFNHFWVPD
jgi:hypothetical protein